MPYKDKNNQALSAKKHYAGNKEKIKEKALRFTAEARKRNRIFIKEYLEKHPCIDCNEGDIIVLEFDHVGTDKIMDISTAANRPWSLKKLQEEIDKCEVRCCNCHRRITHNRRL